MTDNSAYEVLVQKEEELEKVVLKYIGDKVVFLCLIFTKYQIVLFTVLVCLLSSSILCAGDITREPQYSKTKENSFYIQLSENEQAWINENPSIRLGFNPDMRPLLIRHADGKNSGILPDIFTQLETITGLNVRIEVGPWKDIIDQATSKQIDGLLLCVPDLAREKGLLLTKEYISTIAVVFGKTDTSFQINNIKDLKGKRVAYMRAVKFIENILAPLKNDVTGIETESFISALSLVLEGKADIALGMNFDTFLLHESVLTGIEPIFIDTPQAIKAVTAVRSDWPELIGILNKGLTAIGETNINSIVKKWTQLDPQVQKMALSDSELAWLEAHPVIRVGADASWAPIEFLDADGTYKGLSIDYLKKIEPFLGIEFNFIRENWQDLIDRAKRKQLDLFTCVASTPEREQYLLFTEPYIRMPAGIFAQKDVAYIADLKMIGSKKISVVEGYAIHDYLAATYPDMNLVLAKTPEDGIRKVLSKEAFAYIDNIITTGHVISHKGYLDIKMVGEFPFVHAQRMGVRKDWPQFRSILEKAIAAIPDSQRNAIFNQWVPVTYEKPMDYSLVWKIGSGCLILIFLIFFWNRKLATEVSRQTAEYRKSENRFRNTFDGAGIGMGLVSFEGTWLRVNQALCDIVGYTKDELLEMTVKHVTYPEDLEKNQASVGDLLAGKANSCEMEMRYLHKDGRVIWIQLIVSILRDEKEQPLTFLKQIQDITERRRAEENIRKNEYRYRTILQTAIDGFWITNRNGQFLEVNEAYSQMSGYSQNELLTMQISDIEAGEDPEQIEKHIKRGMEIGYDRFESFHRRKDNSIYPVEVNFRYSDMEGGNFIVFIKNISEQKKAENDLLKNQYYLTKAQEIGKIGTWELDIQKNSLIWTDENYKIFGVPLGTKLNYEIFLSCIHPEDRDYVNKKWNEALTIKSYDIMHRVVADNKVKWVREKADIEFDSEGNPTIAVGFTQDLTGLKEIENALQESEKKFKTMFEKAPLSYQSLDENGCFNEVNQTWLKTMGYTRDEVLGKNFSEFLVPEWKDHFKENFPRFKAVGEILGVEFEMVKKNGDVILVSFHGKIAKNKIGEFKQTHCIFQDITSARQAEESSKRLRERLESLWNITKIADSDIKTISDHVLKEAQKMTQSRYAFYGFLDKNENDMILHAWSHETMDDCSTNEKTIHFPIDKAGIWAEAVKQKKILTINDFNLDRPGKKGVPDGHVQLTRLMAVPYIKNDKVISIVAVANKDAEYSNEDENQVLAFMRNVQLLIDRKAAEKEANDLAIQLQQMQKMESIGNLAGGIAHDFNNLLFPIMGMSELLLEDLPSDSLEYENAQEIFNAGKRASELVQQILAFSRQSEHKMLPVRLQNIVREVLKLSRSTIPTDIEIVQDIQTDCGSVRGDATQIHQVVMNLITNAYHAVQENGGKIKVQLKQVKLDSETLPDITLEKGQCVMLSVSDTGVGIENKDLKKIFEPYFTTKEKGKGTGLGLAVVFGIIKEHQGDIKVYSEEGRGTTFNVYLPLIGKTTKSIHIGQLEEIEVGTERILLVDDEISIAKLESQMLLRLGYRVTQQTSSIEALNIFKSNPENFDLVITDMTMPKMTGDRLAREVLRIRPDIPIIICTGYSERVNEERSKSIGVKGFLMKPVVKSDMAKMVKKILDESKKTN